jgi:predicted O-methyltransferase YrrM
MSPLQNIKRLIANINKSAQYLAEIVAGTANQSRIINDKLDTAISSVEGQSHQTGDRLDAVIKTLDSQTSLMNEKLDALVDLQKEQLAVLNRIEAPALSNGSDSAPADRSSPTSFQTPPAANKGSVENAMPSMKSDSAFLNAMQQIPLLLDEKTYNTSHPDYDASSVRNFPGHIFSADVPCDNSVYPEIKKLAKGDVVPDKAWKKILKKTLKEARSVPHAEQVFERRDFIEDYTAELNRKYGAHYAAGWVNLDDAIYLYWLIRHLKPETVVQTGVCNGLSSAFMMLALVQNGPKGKLHVIDLPPVFDPNDPAWTAEGKVYGVTIPEGKTSGWMVPDAYRDRIEILNGDAKELLPQLIDRLDSVDMFYHDSDHTYNHMMFEFREAKRKLTNGGLIVGDDISWNASVWDFADEYGVPSYNYKGAVGTAFF